MDQINKLLHDNLYDYVKYDDIDETFALKIYENDLEYLKEKYKSLRIKKYKKEYFFLACGFSNRSDIIDFLIEKYKINIHHDRHGSNYCLGIACKYNTNLEIIKHLIETLNVDINHTNDSGDDCLVAACHNNSNLDIIKYFVEDLNINIYKEHIFNKNSLFVACQYNENLEIIKYLVEHEKINIDETNTHGYNYLMVACCENKNLSIIKYLVENVKININHCDNNGDNCFVAACENKNHEIILYLIDNTKVNITLRRHLHVNFFIEIISMTKNYHNLNLLIEQGITKYEKKYIKSAIQSICPWFLNEINCKSFDISYPYDLGFNTFIKQVDMITFHLPLFEIDSCISKPDIQNIVHIDHSEQPEILFINNGVNYYGYRNIVLNSILFLKELLDDKCFDFNEIIVLDVKVSKYIINLYIESCYTNQFYINNIKPENLTEFINFIDQYPTTVICLNNLENELINYMIHHKIIPDAYIKNISIKYQFKKMFVHIHNMNLTSGR